MVSMPPRVSVPVPARPAAEDQRFSLAGEVDFLAVPAVWSTLEPHLGGDGDVVIDVGGVSFIDAAGCRLLVRAAEALGGQRHLVLVGASAHVLRVLEICADLPNPRLVFA